MSKQIYENNNLYKNQGYDIEDAIILNKASLDRGYGRVAIFKRYLVEFEKYKIGVSDILEPPEHLIDMGKKRRAGGHFHRERDHALDKSGLARIGERVFKKILLLILS